MNKLKYASYTIAFQEVPNEVSLILNITGCRHFCDGCHSQYLSEDTGNYVEDDIYNLIKKYSGFITCVCFMGGDQNLNELKQWGEIIKNKFNLKFCVYSGSDDLSLFEKLIPNLDYLKIGSYKKELGGLDSVNTNQKFYKILNNSLEDITEHFRKR